MIAVVALVLLTQATDTPVPAQPASQQAQQPAAPDAPRDEVVCRQEVMLGSAIPQRVCETRRARDERAENLGEHMRHAVSSAQARGAVVTNAPTGGH